MSYYFFLGNTMLPVPPPRMNTKINGKNKTINLINEGEVNLIKTPGLTEISFDFLLPNSRYPFANYDSSLQTGLINYAVGAISSRIGGSLGNAFSFKKRRRSSIRSSPLKRREILSDLSLPAWVLIILNCGIPICFALLRIIQ